MSQGYTPVQDKMERDFAYSLQQQLRNSDEFNVLLQEVAQDALVPLYAALDELRAAMGKFTVWEFENGGYEKVPSLKQWKIGRQLWGDISRANSNVHQVLNRRVDNPEGKRLYEKVDAAQSAKIAKLKKANK